MDILILRDPSESSAKCSLTPIRGAAGVRFVSWRPGLVLEVGRRILLDPAGAELEPGDRGLDLLVLDSSWRKLERLRRSLRGELVPRRLPALVTAYPRRSKTFADPAEGLASIEALYAATVLLGAPRADLLAAYRWRDEFLRANASRLPR